MTTLLPPERIHTASLYPLATLRERIGDDIPVLVTRHWPRYAALQQAGTEYPAGQRKSAVVIWRRDLAPSATLLKRYKSGEIEWEQFAALYRAEVTPHIPDFRAWCTAALRLFPGIGGGMVLLCHEHDGENCHRHILHDLLLETDGEAHVE